MFSIGDIVLALVPNPDGSAADHVHPAVVVSAEMGGIIWLVAISTSFQEPPPAHWIKLPWHPNRRVATGLGRKCVAKCNWMVRFAIAKIDRKIGVVPTIQLRQILEQIKILGQEAPG